MVRAARMLWLGCSCVLACGDPTVIVSSDGDGGGEQPRGCAKTMFDSVGASYPTVEWCFPSVGDDSPVPEDCGEIGEPGIVFSFSEVFKGCSACNAGFAPTSDCRPFVCESDDDCPMFRTESYGEVHQHVYVCENGLCLREGEEGLVDGGIARWYASALCLAPFERGTGSGTNWCPGVDPDSDDPCPLPLPETCLQP
jgi:hypothetical protein